MTKKNLQINSVVLYKSQPAKILNAGDKLEIELLGGRTVKVRAKDVQLLHPGPVKNLQSLQITPEGDPLTAWELLAGEVFSLEELCELAFDGFTPASAWAAWQLVTEGLYFYGTLSAIKTRTPEDVTAEKMARSRKIHEKARWDTFIDHLERGQITADDRVFVAEIEALALGKTESSRALKSLKRAETAENAHALLLKLGIWNETLNPHPVRLGADLTQPAQNLPPLPRHSRKDLRHLPAFAIDDEGSHDPDDALSIEEGRLWVHIADVAALISPDSPADLEARERGANLYLPDKTISMLPPSATEILALGLSEDSPALSFALDFDEDGMIAHTEIVPSIIRVTRFSYTHADAQLEKIPALKALSVWAKKFHACRIANGAIELDLPEVRTRVDDNGTVSVRPILPLKSRHLVREAMLACGQALAEFAQWHSLPFPFASQNPPENTDPLPAGLAGMFAQRRRMKGANLSLEPQMHVGLGLSCYAQVTSPLRRYGDLLAHQQLGRFLQGETLLSASEISPRLAIARTAGYRLRRAERLSNRHWKLVYLIQNPNWEGEGIVVERVGKRSTLLIPALDIEIKKSLRSDLPLNGRVNLQLKNVDLAQLEAYFELR